MLFLINIEKMIEICLIHKEYNVLFELMNDLMNDYVESNNKHAIALYRKYIHSCPESVKDSIVEYWT